MEEDPRGEARPGRDPGTLSMLVVAGFVAVAAVVLIALAAMFGLPL